jgi:hypothetical protein
MLPAYCLPIRRRDGVILITSGEYELIIKRHQDFSRAQKRVTFFQQTSLFRVFHRIAPPENVVRTISAPAGQNLHLTA